MSNQTFKIGEVAVYIGDPDRRVIHPSLRERIGCDCEIVGALGSRSDLRGPQYTIKFSCGKTSRAYPWSLKKRRPPEQPSAFSYDEIISMCNDKSITDIRPTETQVREGLKGILEPFGSGEKSNG